MPPRDITITPTSDPIVDITRRRLLTAIPALGVFAAGINCGDDDDDGDADPTATSDAISSGGGFPRTFTHKYGETTVERAPVRVVCVGLIEQDALLALGIVPVATTEWFGGDTGEVHEWAKPLLASNPAPEVLSGELDIEKIASLNPDLVLSIYAGITPDDYARLSAVAPTIAQPAEYVDYGVPWQDLTLTVGQAVGKEAQARELIGGVEQLFATTRQKHPEFEGKTFALLAPLGDDPNVWMYGVEDLRVRPLKALGLELSPEVVSILDEDKEGFGLPISREQFSVLESVDVVIWFVTQEEEFEALSRDAVYASLSVARENRHIAFISTAWDFGTVVSLPAGLEVLESRLAAALDGNPSTIAG